MRTKIFQYVAIAGLAAFCAGASGGNAPVATPAPAPPPARVAPIAPASSTATPAPVAPVGSSPIAPSATPAPVAPIASTASAGAGAAAYNYTPGTAVAIVSNGVSGPGKTNSVYWITNAPYGNPVSGYTNQSIHPMPLNGLNTNKQ